MSWKIILSKWKRFPLFALLLTYVFVVSGLIVCLLCLLLLVIWPFSKNLYRNITTQLAYSLLGQYVWMCRDWGRTKIYVYGDKETFDHLCTKCILVSNHRGDLDWVLCYAIAADYNFLHTTRTLPKKSVLYVPAFGQLLWMLECPFLSRNFAKDEILIKRTSEIYKNYPFPVQVAIYPEGTRFTWEKYEKAVQFARERGLKELKHHLIPRTKGFAILTHYLKKAHFRYLIDVAVAYPPSVKYTPSFPDLLLGRPIETHIYMRCIPLEELPMTQEELSTYCYQLFQKKDEIYDYFLQHGKFPAPLRPTPPSSGRVLWGLRLNQLFWTVLLCSPLVCFSLFFSWTTLAIVMGVSSLVVIVVMLSMLKYVHQPVKQAGKKGN